MLRKFLICVAPSEVHTFHMVERLRTGGFSIARIRAFLGFNEGAAEEHPSFNPDGDDGWASTGACGGLSSLEFPDLEAQRYEEKLRAGRIVICVQADNPEELEDVMQIFEEARGEEISVVADVGHSACLLSKAP